MTSFEDIKKIARETAEVIADRSAVFARTTADKAKIMAKITMISADMAGDKETLRKLYQELGRQYYALAERNPIEELEPTLASLKAANDRLDAKKAEVDSLKANLKANSDGSIDADYEDVPDDEVDGGAEQANVEPECAESTVNTESAESTESTESKD